MSDTPRTDALLEEFLGRPRAVDLARTLERELAEEKARGFTMSADLERLRQCLLESQAWEAEAKEKMIETQQENAALRARTPCEDHALQALVNEQAEDEGLWFEARTAPEGYLQAALRRLHAAIEGKS